MARKTAADWQADIEALDETIARLGGTGASSVSAFRAYAE